MGEKNGAYRIVFVTNICTHYTIKLFELLAQRYHLHFYFTGGHENYWDRKNRLWQGKFQGQYLKGFFLPFLKVKITPGLFKLISAKNDFFIKTYEDRFALPFIFLLSKLKRRPFILWTQMWSHPQTAFHRFSFFFMKFIYKYTDAFIVYGKHVKQYLEGLNVPSCKIFIASHSVDNSLFNKVVSDEKKRELKRQLNIGHEKVLLYVGRLEKCKGLDYLIEAVSGLPQPCFQIIFIGNGEEKDRLMKRCQELSFKTHFLNHISNDQLYHYYSIADIFVLPSITTRTFKEPWGVVVNEAMNQGCPIVATDAVGAAMGGLVEHGKNGFIVPERNVDALKEALSTLIADDGLRVTMGRNSREKIMNWGPEQTLDGFVGAIDYVSRRKG